MTLLQHKKWEGDGKYYMLTCNDRNSRFT